MRSDIHGYRLSYRDCQRIRRSNTLGRIAVGIVVAVIFIGCTIAFTSGALTVILGGAQ
jgi:hypothetical protein